METAALLTGVGSFILGFVLGTLLARRGRRMRLDWRLQIDTDEGPESSS